MQVRFTSRYSTKNRYTSFSDLSKAIQKQISAYLEIFQSNGFSEHWEVNNYISQHNMWDEFKDIRAMNDHGYVRKIRGILPKYYAIVCSQLHIMRGDGAPLLHSESY